MVPSPMFSVVIPVYDRADTIGRAVESCLGQDFEDYEVVVVDDGSTDGSDRVVRSYADPRLHLLRHAQNRGVNPARNTGVRAAAGDWIVFLDSDDELMPTALRTMDGRMRSLEQPVGRMAFMCRDDCGHLSPDPWFGTPQAIDYRRYLQWLDTVSASSDFCNCIRRETFEEVQLPENRALEISYHLDFASRYVTEAFPDVVRECHSDARERYSTPSPRRLALHAVDNACAVEACLRAHGPALREWAPRAYWSLLRGAARDRFISGDRAKGTEGVIRCLLHDPGSLKTWGLWLLGLIGPSVLCCVWSKYLGTRAGRPRASGGGAIPQ